MTAEQKAELARCDREIEACEGIADAGAALGWLDWQAEKLEIEKQAKAERYKAFLNRKALSHPATGFKAKKVHDDLFSFQKFTVRRALELGRSGAYLDCGLGKTFVQLEFASQVAKREKKPVLVLTPLAVSMQTVAEAERWGYKASFSRRQDMTTPIQVTNYANIHHFDPAMYAGIVADESGCLKGDGPLRKSVQSLADQIPYRLSCTATPAPNDYMELGNQSEFVGNLSSAEMLATYFCHDGGETSKWRLKGHARKDFWRWVASWSVFAAKPSDLGFSDEGYRLPPLEYHQHIVGEGYDAGLLFDVEAESLQERRNARRDSIEDRCAKAAQLVNGSGEPWVVWCNLNDESAMLAKMIDGAVEVQGSHSDEHKEDAMVGFASGRYRHIVTKPSIAGWGMNWQHCASQAFVGLSDSWEQLYQAVRRSWRFGQTRSVNIHIITSMAEGAVVRNIQRKDDQARVMSEELSQIAREIYVQNR
jgi:hypothetical protein